MFNILFSTKITKIYILLHHRQYCFITFYFTTDKTINIIHKEYRILGQGTICNPNSSCSQHECSQQRNAQYYRHKKLKDSRFSSFFLLPSFFLFFRYLFFYFGNFLRMQIIFLILYFVNIVYVYSFI